MGCGRDQYFESDGIGWLLIHPKIKKCGSSTPATEECRHYNFEILRQVAFCLRYASRFEVSFISAELKGEPGCVHWTYGDSGWVDRNPKQCARDGEGLDNAS